MTATRKVVTLRADADTQAALAAWATAQGFDLAAGYGGAPRPAAEFDFHVTLFATVEPCDLPEIAGPVPPLVLVPSAFAALGDDEATPVIELADDETLADLRAGWLAGSGCTPTYADFRPHVTLSYAWDGTPALDTLPLPDFPIVLDRLVVAALDDAPAGHSTKRAAAPPATDPASILPLVVDLAAALAAAGDDPAALDAIEEQALALGEMDIRSDPEADTVEPLLSEILSDLARRREAAAAGKAITAADTPIPLDRYLRGLAAEAEERPVQRVRPYVRAGGRQVA